MRLLLAALLCLVVTSTASASARTPTFSIVIGHNAPPATRTDLALLRYADDDAARFYQLLSRVSEEALLLTKLDADTARKHDGLTTRVVSPTQHAVDQAFEHVAARVKQSVAAGESPVVFVTYSGHGALDAATEPSLTLADSVLTRSRLHAALASLRPARVHLIVDACHAGAIVGARGAFDHELETERVNLDEGTLSTLWLSNDATKLSHVGLVLAAAGAAQTHEWSEVEAGLFSHEVLSGLLGGADVNADLRIQYSELWAFIAAANHGVRDPRARPDVVVRPPEDDFAATLLALDAARSSRSLRGDLSRFGHFFIELVGGERLLDAHFARGQRALLTLPADRDAYLVVGEQEALIARTAPGSIDVASIDFVPRRRAARGALDQALREGLFESAFGRAYYEGFVDSRDLVPVSFVPEHTALSLDVTAEPPLLLRRLTRITAWSLTAAAGVTALVAGTISLLAKRDFEDSELELPAEALDRRYRRAANTAWIAGASALALGTVSTVLEVRARRHLEVELSLRGVLLGTRF